MTQERLEGIKRFFTSLEGKVLNRAQTSMVQGQGLELVKTLEDLMPNWSEIAKQELVKMGKKR